MHSTPKDWEGPLVYYMCAPLQPTLAVTGSGPVGSTLACLPGRAVAIGVRGGSSVPGRPKCEGFSGRQIGDENKSVIIRSIEIP